MIGFCQGCPCGCGERELMAKHEADTNLQLSVGSLRLRRLAGEDVSLDALPEKPDDAAVPFGLANRYPVERLQQGGFEQVVVAVKNREAASEIRESLATMGICTDSIFGI